MNEDLPESSPDFAAEMRRLEPLSEGEMRELCREAKAVLTRFQSDGLEFVHIDEEVVIRLDNMPEWGEQEMEIRQKIESGIQKVIKIKLAGDAAAIIDRFILRGDTLVPIDKAEQVTDDYGRVSHGDIERFQELLADSDSYRLID